MTTPTDRERSEGILEEMRASWRASLPGDSWSDIWRTWAERLAHAEIESDLHKQRADEAEAQVREC